MVAQRDGHIRPTEVFQVALGAEWLSPEVLFEFKPGSFSKLFVEEVRNIYIYTYIYTYVYTC